jgi:hypothetical protein
LVAEKGAGALASAGAKMTTGALITKWIGIAVVGAVATAGAVAMQPRAPTPRAERSVLLGTPSRPAPATSETATTKTAPTADVGPARSKRADPDENVGPADSPRPDPNVDVLPRPASAQVPAVPAASSLPVAPAASVASSPAPWPRPAPSYRTPPESIADQARTLNGVRGVIAGGDGSRALSSLDDFARRFPASPLGEEALVLRIEALVASGDRDAARRSAARLFSQYPNSAYARRVRSVLGDAAPE